MLTNKETLSPKPASPLHEVFNLANNVLAEDFHSFRMIFNSEPKIISFFTDLRREVKKQHKSTIRFEKTLELIKNASVYQEYDESSITFFGEAQPQVRHILYLLSWGFNNIYNKNDDKAMILKAIISNKRQLSSLAEKLNKPTDKISTSELANAIMKGDFNPNDII